MRQLFTFLEDSVHVPLSGKYRTSWVEESFVFDAPVGKQVSLPNAATYIGSSIRLPVFRILSGIFFFCLAILLFRVAYLQIVQGNTYLVLAEGNRQRVLPIPAERGLLYDRNGIQLTKNVPNFSLAISPQELPGTKTEKSREDRARIVSKLAALIHTDEKPVRELLEEYGAYSYESIIIEEDLDYETALSIQIATPELPGFSIYRGSKRLYLHDFEFPAAINAASSSLSLSHIIGYQGKINPEELKELSESGYLPTDSVGKTGIEKQYESFMRGVYGKKRIEVNTFGREQAVLTEEAPVPGNHIRLSIDAPMQTKMEALLNNTLERNNKARGSAIVMDPRNGEILALVSLPTFDNNHFSGGIDKETYGGYITNEHRPLFNRAIGGTYPSGSTIKIAIAASALHEGIISPATSVVSTGGISVGQWFFPDWLAGGHGVTNVRKSLANSINTFYYYIGGGYGTFEGLGVEKITDYLRLFGFSKQLGIDIPGEAAGFLPSKEWKKEKRGEPWYIGDTYNLSIGQGDLLVTPLQIASMTATVANGGTLYKPHIAKSSVNSVTGEDTPFAPTVLREQVVGREHIHTVQLGMHDCVTSGSCHRLTQLPFSSAGKTGTAQWNNTKDNHAWFTSYAPFENPEIVVTVLIEEGGEGGIISVPIAYEFYRWWSQYRGVDKKSLTP